MKGFKHCIPMMGLLLTSQTLFAVNLNPVMGGYFGMTGGATYAASANATPEVHIFDIAFPIKTSLDYGVGGNFTASLGYRCNKLRVELEGFFNYNPYKQIKIGKYTFKANRNALLSYSGQTYDLAGFINALYEFYQQGTNVTNFAPYVGLGIGYGGISNQFTINFNGNQIYKYSKTASAVMGQGIVGLGYYMDDYCFVGVDYRYIGSGKIGTFGVQMKDQTLNFGFTYAFGG